MVLHFIISSSKRSPLAADGNCLISIPFLRRCWLLWLLEKKKKSGSSWRQGGVEETKKVTAIAPLWIGNFEYFIRKVLCDSPYVLASVVSSTAHGLAFADLNFKWSRRLRPLGSYLGPMLHIITPKWNKKIWSILKYLNQIGINELTYSSFSLGNSRSRGSFKPALGQRSAREEGWLQKWQRVESREL